MLEDAAEIQEEDAAYLNRRQRGPDEPPVQPLYRRGDISGVTRLFQRVHYNQKVELGNGVSFTLLDASTCCANPCHRYSIVSEQPSSFASTGLPESTSRT